MLSLFAREEGEMVFKKIIKKITDFQIISYQANPVIQSCWLQYLLRNLLRTTESRAKTLADLHDIVRLSGFGP